MTRSRARGFLATGVCLATLVIGVAVATELGSRVMPFTGDIAIASVGSLDSGRATKVFVPMLAGLAEKARLERGALMSFGSTVVRASDVRALPVYLVREGNDVRAFIAIDPRNGCDLKVIPNEIGGIHGAVLFYDVCHGSIYDIAGNIAGGPAYWSLDQLAVTVRDGHVYARGDTVIPGRPRMIF